MFRIGCGFDVHRFATGRKLVLGGETIAHPVGLLGHSDADVVLHALCDAMLGAIAAGDIGQRFPPNDPYFLDISSTVLLQMVVDLLKKDAWSIVNVDITVICEQPRIAPYAEKIRRNIGEIIGTGIDAVSVKGTTTERLGFTGREEGIAAMAVALVSR